MRRSPRIAAQHKRPPQCSSVVSQLIRSVPSSALLKFPFADHWLTSRIKTSTQAAAGCSAPPLGSKALPRSASRSKRKPLPALATRGLATTNPYSCRLSRCSFPVACAAHYERGTPCRTPPVATQVGFRSRDYVPSGQRYASGLVYHLLNARHTAPPQSGIACDLVEHHKKHLFCQLPAGM